jgi:hypothetical protein
MQRISEKDVSILDSEVGAILDNMPNATVYKIDNTKELPIFSFLPPKQYLTLEKKIANFRDAILNDYVKGNADVRSQIRTSINEYENLLLVFVPNKDFLSIVEDKEEYMLRILTAISVQNLNDDIRELIIYVNELRKLSATYNINFKGLLQQVIPISSDIATIYSISMREFFENVLHERANPVRGNENSFKTTSNVN